MSRKDMKEDHVKCMEKAIAKDLHPVNMIVPDKELAHIMGITFKEHFFDKFKNYLDDLKDENKLLRCPNCGGLLPDVQISLGKRTYTFTCTKIEDKHGNILAETDYKLLESYCRGRNKQVKRE